MDHDHTDLTIDIELHNLRQLFGSFTVWIEEDKASFATSLLDQIQSRYVGEIQASSRQLRLFKSAYERFSGKEPGGVIVFEVKVDCDEKGPNVIENVLGPSLY